MSRRIAMVLNGMLGLAVGGAGIGLLVYLLLLMLRPESAPLWVHWVEMYVPLPYGNFPSRLLAELPHSAYRWVAWGLAILLCGMGYTALRGAMELAQPPGLAKRQTTPFNRGLRADRSGGALFSLALGIVAVAHGLGLLVFHCLFLWRSEAAFEWSAWLITYTPIREGLFPRHAGVPWVSEPMWASWGATAFLYFVGIDRLRAARDLFRTPDQTSGGKARLVLTTERPRVGAALEGYLVLTDKSKPGQKFQIGLECRDTGSGPSSGGSISLRETIKFRETQSVAVLRVGDEWHVPFSFEVKNAPPSTVRGPLDEWRRTEYSWFLNFCRADALIAIPSNIEIVLETNDVEPAQLANVDPARVFELVDAQVTVKSAFTMIQQIGAAALVGKDGHLGATLAAMAWRLTKLTVGVVCGVALAVFGLICAFNLYLYLSGRLP